MKKILFLDTETTGLDATKHGIIQLAMLMDIDGEFVDEISLDIQPFQTDLMSIQNDDNIFWADNIIWKDEATPTGITFGDIAEFMHPYEAMGNIISFLDKHIAKFDKSDKCWIGGYNTRFDLDFLSAFCQKAKFDYLGSYLNWRQLDALHLMWQIDFKATLALSSFKLEEVCKAYCIDLKAHNAMSDIKATRELWYKLQAPA